MSKVSKYGNFDKIFTRVGASDNISQGESTFMIEMLESSLIINNMSERSLILLDEIGRGTVHMMVFQLHGLYRSIFMMIKNHSHYLQLIITNLI